MDSLLSLKVCRGQKVGQKDGEWDQRSDQVSFIFKAISNFHLLLLVRMRYAFSFCLECRASAGKANWVSHLVHTEDPRQKCTDKRVIPEFILTPHTIWILTKLILSPQGQDTCTIQKEFLGINKRELCGQHCTHPQETSCKSTRRAPVVRTLHVSLVLCEQEMKQF